MEGALVDAEMPVVCPRPTLCHKHVTQLSKIDVNYIDNQPMKPTVQIRFDSYGHIDAARGITPIRLSA
jgi:hypothetical protein